MIIEITKDDILKMICDEHSGDINFLLEIVDNGTNSWYSYCQLINMMIEEVKIKEPSYYKGLIDGLNQSL